MLTRARTRASAGQAAHAPALQVSRHKFALMHAYTRTDPRIRRAGSTCTSLASEQTQIRTHACLHAHGPAHQKGRQRTHQPCKWGASRHMVAHMNVRTQTHAHTCTRTCAHKRACALQAAHTPACRTGLRPHTHANAPCARCTRACTHTQAACASASMADRSAAAPAAACSRTMARWAAG